MSRLFPILSCCFLSVLIAVGGCAGTVDADRLTPFELSGGRETPRYAETVAWLEELADASDLMRLTDFGVSPQGRALPLVIVDGRGRFEPDAPADRGDRIVLLVEACIHAGESCGKDAGMLLLRDLAADPVRAAERLGDVTLLFVPIFNVDGHERYSPWGRINQNGPVEMGWRTTAQNLNLNRDFLKADTPEMQAWLTMWNAWEPDFFVDIHSTDGADYQYALTYGLETGGNLEAGLTEWVLDYREGMHERMAADGFPLSPYVSFRKWHDPRSGLSSWVAGPRFSQGYAALRNRPGLLIETHMLKDYPTRVESTRRMLEHTLDWLNERGAGLRERIAAADRFTAGGEFRARPFPLRFSPTENSEPFEFLGVEYEPVTSAVTGGEFFRFGDRPDTFTVGHYNENVPSVTAHLPEAYLVPAEWTRVLDRLAWHGVRTRRLAEPVTLEVATVRFTDPKWRERPYEGHHTVTFSTEPLTETRTFAAGSVLVPMDQRLARVAAHLLEPEGPDSLVQWGFFDPIFERVEYVESYVIEAMIPKMIEENPSLLEELEAVKAADPDFAANPWAIRMWFYEKTPYYDQRVDIYPVGKLYGELPDLPLE